MITEASEHWEGYLPSCTELSLTHSTLMLFQVNVNVTLLAWPVQLSSAKLSPRGSQSSEEKLFSATPSTPNYCCGIVISSSEDLFIKALKSRQALLTYFACP